MASPGPVPESPLECALRLANGAVAKGLIGGYAVAGPFAFIYYGAEAWRRLRPAP